MPAYLNASIYYVHIFPNPITGGYDLPDQLFYHLPDVACANDPRYLDTTNETFGINADDGFYYGYTGGPDGYSYETFDALTDALEYTSRTNANNPHVYQFRTHANMHGLELFIYYPSA